MCTYFMLLVLAFALNASSGQPLFDDPEANLNSPDIVLPEDGKRAGPSPFPIPTDISQLQSGLGPLMNTLKDGKLVVGGFSFLVIPNPDPTQLQGLASGAGGLPFMGALPGAG